VDDFDDPRNVLSYARRAKSLKQYSTAIRYLNHVIKDYETPLSPYVDPIQEKKINYIESLIELGNIYSILTLHDDAIKSYKKALEKIESNLNDVDPERKESYLPTIYEELSKNYQQLRNYQKSSEFFKRYLQHRNNRIQ
jgi:tetratricopeptide (TPR) repeat protein